MFHKFLGIFFVLVILTLLIIKVSFPVTFNNKTKFWLVHILGWITMQGYSF